MASAASMASAPAMKRCSGFSWSAMVSRARASLAGSPGWLAVHALHARDPRGGPRGVVVDGQLGPGGGAVHEQFGAEVAGLHDRGVDVVRLDVVAQGLHPALFGELGGGVGGGELHADQAGGRGDGDDVAGTLRSHDGQDGAGDVHRAEEVGLELLAHLRGRDLLEVAGEQVPGVVDQDVDAAEAVDGGLRGGLGVFEAGDVQRGDQQVVLRPAQGLLDLVGAAAGGDDLVAGGEGLAGDIRAQTSSGTGDENDLAHGGFRFRLARWA